MNNQFFIDQKMPYVEAKYEKISDTCFTKHYHDNILIVANEDGTTELTFKDTLVRLDKGSLLLINPFEVHSSTPIGKQPRRCHTMFLDVNWCCELQKSIFGNHLKESLPFHQTLLKNQILYLEYISTNKLLLSNSFYLEKEVKLINFLVKLFSKECSSSILNEDYKKNKNIANEIKNILDNNVDNNISLPEIAKELGLDQFKIIRLFKSETHLTPHAYLINAKINKAKYLIKEGVVLGDIYPSLGFYDQSHFNKHFKKIVSMTPREYQNKMAELI